MTPCTWCKIGDYLAGEMNKQRHNGIELEEEYRDVRLNVQPIRWFITSWETIQNEYVLPMKKTS